MPTRHLTVFLLKKSLKRFDDAIETPKDLKAHDVSRGFGFGGRLYIQHPASREPDWASFLRDNVAGDADVGMSQSTGAVLVIRASRRLFAFTFGHAQHLLKRNAFERDFGLKVVVNRVDPKKLRSIDLKSFQELSVRRQEHASRETSLGTFGVDVRQDLLRAVTGTPHSDFAKMLTGSDSLILRAELEFAELGRKCRELLDAYNDPAYKDGDFRWIDNLRAVRDESLVAELDEKLVAALKKGPASDVQMVAPDGVPPNVAYYKYSDDPAGDARYVSLETAEWRASLGDALASLTAREVRQRHVRAYAAEGPPQLASVGAHECFAFETTYQRKRFILSGGEWFAVSTEFNESIRQYIASISKTDLELPNADDRETEPDYIARMAIDAPHLIRLHGVGACRANGDELEPCDFISPKLHLIHLKRWTQSATFSHLLEQGANSAEALLEVPDYRAQVQAKISGLNAALHGCLPAERYAPGNYQVVWALIRKNTEELPFFSRLSLLRAGERVQSRGYRVCYLRVAVG